MPRKTKKLLTITEAARRLKISRQAVHKAIDGGKGPLKARRGEVKIVQAVWLIPEDAIESYEVSLRHKAAGKKITDG